MTIHFGDSISSMTAPMQTQETQKIRWMLDYPESEAAKAFHKELGERVAARIKRRRLELE